MTATDPEVPVSPLSTQRRRVALAAPLVLIAVMYPIFQGTDALVGDAVGGYLGWYLGLAVYWALWGGLFSAWIIGRRELWRLVRPRRPTWDAVAWVALLAVLAAGVRYLVPDMGYDKPTLGAWLLLISSTFGNGMFEETLWRGVYLRLFPDSRVLRVVWPSLWFGLWHLVPVSADGPQLAMVVGPAFMGLYLAFLAKRTDSVWWPAVAHILGGLVMIS